MAEKKLVSVKILQRHHTHKNPPGSVCKMDEKTAATLKEQGFVDDHEEAVANPTDDAVQEIAGIDEDEDSKPKKKK
jgi:hypothetical protein